MKSQMGVAESSITASCHRDYTSGALRFIKYFRNGFDLSEDIRAFLIDSPYMEGFDNNYL